MATCPLCDGTGLSPLEGLQGDPPTNQRKCPVCYGEGSIEEAHGTTKGAEIAIVTLIARLKNGPAPNVFWSYQIWESTDLTEFMALSEGNKDSYRGLVRMGTVSLVDGSHSKTTLWSLFGEGTTTRANLEALIS